MAEQYKNGKHLVSANRPHSVETNMRRFFRWILPFIILALLVALVHLIWGETHITATKDGKPLVGATVLIDGKVVGKTPYTARLFLGDFSIKVIPPKTFNSKQTEFSGFILTVVRGDDFQANFETRDCGPWDDCDLDGYSKNDGDCDDDSSSGGGIATVCKDKFGKTILLLTSSDSYIEWPECPKGTTFVGVTDESFLIGPQAKGGDSSDYADGVDDDCDGKTDEDPSDAYNKCTDAEVPTSVTKIKDPTAKYECSWFPTYN